MKFRVERDVLADAVAWAARSLPSGRSAPVLAGLLIETVDGRRRPAAVDVRLRDLRPGHAARRRRRTRARRWSPAGCSPTSAAACRNKPVEMTIDGAKVALTCGSRPVQPADHAGRGVPDAAGDAAGDAAPCSSDLFAHAVAQAVTAAGRDDMLPVLTGVRHRDRGRPRSRCWPPTGSGSRLRELEWDPAATDVSAAALVPAKVLADTAKSLTAGHRGRRSRWPPRRRRRGDHRLRGRGRRRRTSDDDPAARRRVPQGPLAVPDRAPTVARVDRRRAVEAVKRVVAGRRAQHRRAALLRRRRAHPGRRHR